MCLWRVPEAFKEYLIYEAEFKVFICPKCQHDIPYKSISEHVTQHGLYDNENCAKRRNKNNSGNKTRGVCSRVQPLNATWGKKDLLQGIVDFPQVESGKEYEIPAHGCAPREYLRTVEGIYSTSEGFAHSLGYQCPICPDVLSQSRDSIRSHIYHKHGTPGTRRQKDLPEPLGPFDLQKWTGEKKGKRYWRVTKPDSSSTASTGDSTTATPGLTHAEQQKKLNAERLLKQNKDIQKLSLNLLNERDDTDPWLKKVGWVRLFRKRNKEMIGATRLLNSPISEVMTSSPISVAKLKVVRKAFQRVVHWALWTLEISSWEALRWIRGNKKDDSECNDRPFGRVQNANTEKRYINDWLEFLTYVFRTGLLKKKDYETKYGIRFTAKQIRLIKEIEAMAGDHDDADIDIGEFPHSVPNGEVVHFEDDNDDGEDGVGAWLGGDGSDEGDDQDENVVSDDFPGTNIAPALPIDPLAEKLFELCICFLTQDIDSNAYESPLCHFTAVQGIIVENGTFRKPLNYTTHLSGILWVSRLLMLEYALPRREYKTIDLKNRKAYPKKERLKRAREVHHENLTKGCGRPTSRIMGWLSYGRFIAKSIGPDPKLHYNKETETISLINANVHCKIDDFKRMPRHVLRSATKLLNKLFFRKRLPAIDLKALGDDNMRKGDPGYWISQTLSEGEAFNFMVDLETETQHLLGKDGKYDWRKVKEYLRDKQEFLELLMLLIFLTGGQSPRGPELGTVKFRNSAKTLRNVVVIDGHVFYFTGYNKSAAIRCNSFYVARYLPREVGELLFLYLTYIRPFCCHLYNELRIAHGRGPHPYDGHYLFCDEGALESQQWEGSKLREVMKRETAKILGYQLIPSEYRQIMVHIARIKVGEIAAHFAKDNTLCKEQLKMDKDAVETAIAWQGAHGLGAELDNYGNLDEYPNKLQPWLLSLYFVISQAWHRFLGLLAEEAESGIGGEESGTGGEESGGEESGVAVEESGIGGEQGGEQGHETPRKHLAKWVGKDVTKLTPGAKRTRDKMVEFQAQYDAIAAKVRKTDRDYEAGSASRRGT